MAIRLAVNVGFMVVGDSSTKTFSFDLRTAPLQLISTPENWLTTLPTGVMAASGEYTASLVGTLVTVTFVTPPLAGVGSEYGLIVTF